MHNNMGLCEVARWNDVLLGLIIANGNSAAMPAAPLGAGWCRLVSNTPDTYRPASQGAMSHTVDAVSGCTLRRY